MAAQGFPPHVRRILTDLAEVVSRSDGPLVVHDEHLAALTLKDVSVTDTGLVGWVVE